MYISLPCLTRYWSCLLFPWLSRVKASTTDPGKVPWLPPCILSLKLSLSIYVYLHFYYSGIRLYIMQTPLSIIYLHMYHSCFQPSIIHHLSCRLFDVVHSTIRG